MLPDLKKVIALRRGEVRNLGPIAGTGAGGVIPGIGAADLGEVIQLPDGSYVAVFGDSFGGDRVGTDPHYPSVAVPVAFDDVGRPHFGAPLTGPRESRNPLFIPPRQARGMNTLPAGSVRVDGRTYMLVVGTNRATSRRRLVAGRSHRRSGQGLQACQRVVASGRLRRRRAVTDQRLPRPRRHRVSRRRLVRPQPGSHPLPRRPRDVHRPRRLATVRRAVRRQQGWVHPDKQPSPSATAASANSASGKSTARRSFAVSTSEAGPTVRWRYGSPTAPPTCSARAS